MKDIELKPCPFCGGPAELSKGVVRFMGRPAVTFVFCNACGARGTQFVESVKYCANDRAVEAWNRRVSDKEKGSRSAATEQEPGAVDTALNE